MGLSLSAMGVHRSAQSALNRIHNTHLHTHTYAQRTQVDCLFDLTLSCTELISQPELGLLAHLILWTLALAKSLRLNWLSACKMMECSLLMRIKKYCRLCLYIQYMYCTSGDLSVQLLKFVNNITVLGLVREGEESAYRQTGGWTAGAVATTWNWTCSKLWR